MRILWLLLLGQLWNCFCRTCLRLLVSRRPPRNQWAVQVWVVFQVLVKGYLSPVRNFGVPVVRIHEAQVLLLFEQRSVKDIVTKSEKWLPAMPLPVFRSGRSLVGKRFCVSQSIWVSFLELLDIQCFCLWETSHGRFEASPAVEVKSFVGNVADFHTLYKSSHESTQIFDVVRKTDVDLSRYRKLKEASHKSTTSREEHFLPSGTRLLIKAWSLARHNTDRTGLPLAQKEKGKARKKATSLRSGW